MLKIQVIPRKRDACSYLMVLLPALLSITPNLLCFIGFFEDNIGSSSVHMNSVSFLPI